jgi:YfiH family protein
MRCPDLTVQAEKADAPRMLQARSLAALSRVRHAFFTRAGGVSHGVYTSLNGGTGSNDAADKVAENRARMAAAVGVSAERFLTPYQIHSPTAVVAERAWDAQTRPRADAVVTRVARLAVGISTADCGPVLLSDAEAGVVGAAHAGWRGALGGIIEATVEAMVRLGAQRHQIIAALGPMIRQQNYEVGPDLVAQFLAADADNARFFAAAAKPDHPMFDLAGYICARLQRAGITAVEDLQACTYADPAQFYSYRRATHLSEPDYGRHISTIALTN